MYQWEQELFDGSKKIFEKVRRQDTVVIIPSTKDGKLIFIKDEQPSREAISSFPSGRMDKEGEEPLATAQRELLEETGYESEEWSLYKAYQPVTKVDWAIYVIVAKRCQKTQEAQPGPGEKITLSLVTLDFVLEHVHDEHFDNGDVGMDLLEAKYNPEARKLLENRIFS